jgi:hypothetical protein
MRRSQTTSRPYNRRGALSITLRRSIAVALTRSDDLTSHPAIFSAEILSNNSQILSSNFA